MSIIVRMRKQDAIYWAPTGRKDRNGNPLFAAPVAIRCRWEDVHELFLDMDGNQQVSNAIVYVDQDVALRGYLKLGELDEYVADVPRDNDDVFIIRKFENLPNLRVTRFLKVAML